MNSGGGKGLAQFRPTGPLPAFDLCEFGDDPSITSIQVALDGVTLGGNPEAVPALFGGVDPVVSNETGARKRKR
jgi:hypothetical protein